MKNRNIIGMVVAIAILVPLFASANPLPSISLASCFNTAGEYYEVSATNTTKGKDGEKLFRLVNQFLPVEDAVYFPAISKGETSEGSSTHWTGYTVPGAQAGGQWVQEYYSGFNWVKIGTVTMSNQFCQ